MKRISNEAERRQQKARERQSARRKQIRQAVKMGLIKIKSGKPLLPVRSVVDPMFEAIWGAPRHMETKMKELFPGLFGGKGGGDGK